MQKHELYSPPKQRSQLAGAWRIVVLIAAMRAEVDEIEGRRKIGPSNQLAPSVYGGLCEVHDAGSVRFCRHQLQSGAFAFAKE